VILLLISSQKPKFGFTALEPASISHTTPGNGRELNDYFGSLCGTIFELERARF